MQCGDWRKCRWHVFLKFSFDNQFLNLFLWLLSGTKYNNVFILVVFRWHWTSNGRFWHYPHVVSCVISRPLPWKYRWTSATIYFFLEHSQVKVNAIFDKTHSLPLCVPSFRSVLLSPVKKFQGRSDRHPSSAVDPPVEFVTETRWNTSSLTKSNSSGSFRAVIRPQTIVWLKS